MRRYTENEFDRLLLSQHEHVIQVYAKTISDRNSLIIVLERAKYGDLDSYYSKLIDKTNRDRETLYRFDPYSGKIDQDIGIASHLSWRIVSVAMRLLLVF
jgi:hypothetical protein